MKYARIVDSIVVEVFTPPENLTLNDCFTPEVAALFDPCPDNVDQHWTREADGTFTEPPAIEIPPDPEPEPEPAAEPTEPTT